MVVPEGGGEFPWELVLSPGHQIRGIRVSYVPGGKLDETAVRVEIAP
jgi:hypothetical protein